jgi:hypothetical protein
MDGNADRHLFDDADSRLGRRCSEKEAQDDVNSIHRGQAPASLERPIVGTHYYNRADTRTFKPIAANWDVEEFSSYCSRTPP